MELPCRALSNPRCIHNQAATLTEMKCCKSHIDADHLHSRVAVVDHSSISLLYVMINMIRIAICRIKVASTTKKVIVKLVFVFTKLS